MFAPADGIVARTPILYLHGIQSHGGWFVESARRLAEAGHVVLMPDRRGSGANGRDRGHARSVRQLLDDGRVLLDRAAELTTHSPLSIEGEGAGVRGSDGVCPPPPHPGHLPSGSGSKPVHLLGVSWGGKWALALAAEFPDRVASLALSTPGLYSQRTLGLPARLAVAACSLFAPRTKFTIPLSEPELFTDVPRWRQFISDDPLRLRKATARFMLISHLMERRLPHWAAKAKCPTLLLLADRDPIIDNERVLSLLTGSLPAELLTVKRFASAVHTLEFSVEPEPYYSSLLDWFSRRSGRGEAAPEDAAESRRPVVE